MKVFIALAAIFSLASAHAVDSVSNADRKCATDNNIPIAELEKWHSTRTLPDILTVSQDYKAMVKCTLTNYSYLTEDGEINENMCDICKVSYHILKAVPKIDDNLDYVYNLAVTLTAGVKKQRASSEESNESSEEKNKIR